MSTSHRLWDQIKTTTEEGEHDERAEALVFLQDDCSQLNDIRVLETAQSHGLRLELLEIMLLRQHVLLQHLGASPQGPTQGP